MKFIEKRIWLLSIILFAVLLSIYRRSIAVLPYSLCLDDLWVVILAKHGSIPFILTTGFPCPQGFIFVLKFIGMFFGFGALQMQLLPLAASLLQIPLIAYIVRKTTNNYSLSILAAIMLSGNSMLTEVSVRIKPFAFDSLIILIILSASLMSLEHKEKKYFLFLSLFSAAAVFISFVSIFFSVFAVLAVHLRLFVANRDKGVLLRKTILYSAAVYCVIVFAWFIFFIKGRGNPSLYLYWKYFYVPIDTLKNAVVFLKDTGSFFFKMAFIQRMGWLAVFIPAGIYKLIRDEGKRPVGWAILLFYVGIFTASALKMYPVGGGRTDVFSYPISIFSAVVGLWMLAGKIWQIPVLLSILGLALYCFGYDTCIDYPKNSSKKTVQLLLEYEKKGDFLVVFPWANWALGYYGKWKPVFIKVDDSTNAFYTEIKRPNTYVLRESYKGKDFTTSPDVVASQLGFLKSKPERVLYLASSILYSPNQWIINTIISYGYSIEYKRQYVDGCFVAFSSLK